MSSLEPPGGGEEAPIASLPAPLLATILRLSTEDGAEFLRLAAVCRAWRDVVLSGQSWPHVHTLRLCAPGGLSALQLAPNLESLSVTALGGVGLGLELTLQAPPSLRRLELGVTRLAPTVLLALCSPALEVLDLRGSRVDGRTLAEVLKRCSALRQLSCDRLSCDLSRLPEGAGRSLTHLRLGGTCTGLDAVALGAIAIGSPGLQVLEVDGSFLACIPVAVLELEHLHSLHVDNAKLRDESLVAEFDAARPVFPSLTMLSIPSCRSMGCGFRALAAALSSPDAPPLKRLIASNLLDLTDEDGATLLQAVRERGGDGGSSEARLALDVSCCGRLGARFFAECSKLHFLEFCAGGLPLLTAEALSQIAASGALSHTSTLVLNDCEQLQLRRGGDRASRALKAAACSAGKSLKRLLLNDCALDDEAARAIAGACPSLITLSLVAVSNLSDAGMLSLATHCGALRNLTVGGTRARFTPASIGAFRGLHSLRITRYGQLEDDSLASIVRCSPDLHALTLAAGGSVTDTGLACLALAAPRLRELVLRAEDHPRLRGCSLRLFTALRTLDLDCCPAVTVDSLVRVLVACPYLLDLRLPLELERELLQRIPVRAV